MLKCKVYFFLLILSITCAADSCSKCRATHAQLILDPSIEVTDAIVEDVLSSLETLCNSTYTTFAEVEKCLNEASSFMYDLHRDLNSESEHHNDVRILQTESLCAIISACGTRCCITDWDPEQIHLSVTLDPTEMVVSWITFYELENPTVDYWSIADEHSTNLTIHTAKASISTYTSGGWLGTIYNCTLSNLEPGTAYRYRIYGETDSPYYLTEQEYHFITDIEPSSTPLQTRTLDTRISPFEPGVSASVIAYSGDFATEDNSREVADSLVRLAQNKTVQMVVQGGDLAYADTNQTQWDLFFRMNERFSNTIPVMAAVGNHENYYHFDAYNHRYFMPNAESGSQSQQYFSFNYEKIHFVVWSFEEFRGIDLLPNGKQRAWLEADLQKANQERDVRPWVVLLGHRPFYCSADSHDCEDVAQYLRDLLEDLINEYHVDVVLQSHKHNYERTYPVYKSQATAKDYTDPAAPMYYVVGIGGRDKNDDWQTIPPQWSADRDTKYGYLLMSAPDETTFEMVYLSKSFNVHDKASIVRTQNITNWTFSH